MSSSLEILSNIVNNLTPGSELFVVVAVGVGVGGGTLVRGNILISVGEIIFVFLLNFVNSASHVSCKQIINTEHMCPGEISSSQCTHHTCLGQSLVILDSETPVIVANTPDHILYQSLHPGHIVSEHLIMISDGLDI